MIAIIIIIISHTSLHSIQLSYQTSASLTSQPVLPFVLPVMRSQFACACASANLTPASIDKYGSCATESRTEIGHRYSCSLFPLRFNELSLVSRAAEEGARSELYLFGTKSSVARPSLWLD